MPGRSLSEAWAASKFEPTAAFVTQKARESIGSDISHSQAARLRRYEMQHDAAQDRFRQEIAKLNKRVRDYNLNCPASAQMVPFDTVEEVHGVCKHLQSSTPNAYGKHLVARCAKQSVKRKGTTQRRV